MKHLLMVLGLAGFWATAAMAATATEPVQQSTGTASAVQEDAASAAVPLPTEADSNVIHSEIISSTPAASAAEAASSAEPDEAPNLLP